MQFLNCTKCGYPVPDDVLNCPSCGSRVTEQPNAQPDAQEVIADIDISAIRRKKAKKTTWITRIVAVFVLFIALSPLPLGGVSHSNIIIKTPSPENTAEPSPSPVFSPLP